MPHNYQQFIRSSLQIANDANSNRVNRVNRVNRRDVINQLACKLGLPYEAK